MQSPINTDTQPSAKTNDFLSYKALVVFACNLFVAVLLIQGAWVLQPRNTKPTSVIHFIGGVFVGAAPQLTYRYFLDRLSEK